MRINARIAVGFLVALLLLMPTASAHVALQTYGSNSYSYVAQAVCTGTSTTLPSGNSCTKILFVPPSATHVHTTFVFPFLGLATLNVNLQETTELIGDFVVYSDRTCTTGLIPFTVSSGVTCFGGEQRNWHAGRNHKFRGEGQEPACTPTYCRWVVATHWF